MGSGIRRRGTDAPDVADERAVSLENGEAMIARVSDVKVSPSMTIDCGRE
jgi:hypothetical protein